MPTPPREIRAAAQPLNAVGGGEAAEFLRAEAAQDGAAPKPRRFNATAYTGGPMAIDGFYLPVVIDLEGMAIPRQDLPALRQHDPEQLVGHTESVSVTAQRVKAAGVVSGVGDAAAEVVAVADNGFPWQVSAGWSAERVEFVDRGETVKVNGRSVTGPLYVARATTLREISFVPIGADGATSATVAAHQGGSPMTFAQWLAARGVTDENALAPMIRAALQAQFEAEQKPAPKPGPANPPTPDEDIARNRRVYAAEAERVAGITALRARYGSPTAEVEENGQRRAVPIEAHAIASGWPVERAELEMLRAARPNPASARPDPAADRLLAQTVEAAVGLTAGLRPDLVAAGVPQADRERVMNEATGARFQGYSLHALMDATIRAAGGAYHGSRKSNEFVRAAIAAERQILASGGGFTTISLSGTLSNVANKAMLQAYQARATTWRQVAAVRSHADFKVVNRYRLDMTGAFKKVGPDGELKHVGMTETGYTNQLATYGAIIALTRQMQINDDLGAFLEIPQGLGSMAAVRVEEAVYVTLLSNPSSFFASGNGNLQTGGGSALGIAGLTASETGFSNQVDPNGKPILTQPDRILVGTALGVTANNLYTQTTLANVGGDPSANTLNANPHAGKYKPVVTPYLNNTAIKDQDGAAISGQSATLWYQLADPNVRAAIAVAFLNGRETPVVESAETEFSTLGMQWRAYHDFGVGMEDTAGATKNAGA